MGSKIAILLPSYKRRGDLENVLRKTPLSDGKFIVVANYPEGDFLELSRSYSDRAIFIDETKLGKLGVCGAYNEAFKHAFKKRFQYCVLFADDVLPFKKSWLNDSIQILEDKNASVGIFSSDEGHFGTYGWNVIKDAPIGHFFIAKVSDFKTFFDPRYMQYVIDLEIIVRAMKQGKKIVLLPVRVRHYRSQLNRETYGENYQKDVALFLKDYPEYKGWMNSSGKEVYIPESNKALEVKKGWELPKAYPWPDHKSPSKFTRLFSKLRRAN